MREETALPEWGVKSFLLNVWREVGNSVRYGDAKCVLIAGVGFSLLVSYVRFVLMRPGETWGIMLSHDLEHVGGKDLVVVSLFFVSFCLSALALIPVIARRSCRISAIIWMNRNLRHGGADPAKYGVVYFRDIAMYATPDAYGAALEKRSQPETKLDTLEADVATQIWIVSRIATTKFMLANFAIYFLFAAMALVFLFFVF